MAEKVETPVKEEAVDLDRDSAFDEPDEFDPVFDQAPEEPEEEEASAPEAEVEAAEAPPPPAAHDPAVLERAAVLMIPADEIAAMTPDELKRVVKHADRIGQTVYESFQKPAPKEEPKPADEFAVLDDPEKYDQDFVKPIKTALQKQAEENRILRERLEKLEQTHASTRQQQLHTKLMAQLPPEAVKEFDISTPTGQARYQELLEVMHVKHKHNKTLTEAQLLQRAVKGMDILPEKPREDPEIAEKKRAWEKAALAKPSPRQAAQTAVDRVGEILKNANRKPVNGK